jgi:hypothetical protein
MAPVRSAAGCPGGRLRLRLSVGCLRCHEEGSIHEQKRASPSGLGDAVQLHATAAETRREGQGAQWGTEGHKGGMCVRHGHQCQ